MASNGHYPPAKPGAAGIFGRGPGRHGRHGEQHLTSASRSGSEDFWLFRAGFPPWMHPRTFDSPDM